MSAHARFSPSKAQRFMTCAGSLGLEELCPDTASKFAMEGTAAHQLLEWALQSEAKSAHAFQGRNIIVTEGEGAQAITEEYEADEKMCDYIQSVVDDVLERVAAYKLMPGVVNVTLHSERRVDFSAVVGVPDQFGTADIIIVVEYDDGSITLFVGDLKYGKGVAVYAEGNEQLMTYALGLASSYEVTSDVRYVDMAIYMPRLDYIDTHAIEYRDLKAFGDELRIAVKEAEKQAAVVEDIITVHGENDLWSHIVAAWKAKKITLTAGDKQCQFCKAKADCPALQNKALSSVMDTFTDLDEVEGEIAVETKRSINKLDSGIVPVERLSELMQAADLIEDWIKAVRSRVETMLLTGQQVPGFKVVAGRRGHRYWADKQAVENILKKKMRLKDAEMFSMTLISPTQAETKFKKTKPRQWELLAEHIDQPEGSPTIAPESDKRPALVMKSTADEFDDLGADDSDDFGDVC